MAEEINYKVGDDLNKEIMDDEIIISNEKIDEFEKAYLNKDMNKLISLHYCRDINSGIDMRKIHENSLKKLFFCDENYIEKYKMKKYDKYYIEELNNQKINLISGKGNREFLSYDDFLLKNKISDKTIEERIQLLKLCSGNLQEFYRSLSLDELYELGY